MKRILLSILILLSLSSVCWADITTGLIHWWKFDEASSGACNGVGAALDSGANNLPLTCNNLTYYPGKVGLGEVYYTGATNHYSVTAATEQGPQTGGSWAAWVYPQNATVTTIWLSQIHYVGNDDDPAYMQAAYLNTGALWGRIGQESKISIQTQSSAGLIFNNTWYHFVMTWDGGTSPSGIKLYINGAGAEILNDRVRKLVSNGKCGAQEWLDIMHEAHLQDLTTSATMMFGHVETLEERFEHFVKIREVQAQKPEGAKGFLAFIPWTFQDVDTLLQKIRGTKNLTTAEEYIRMIALSRIMLPNVKNIQASWLTVGKQVAQICLNAGANDFGSIMIEENVVSAAGAPHRFTAKSIQQSIREAGFEPQLRNQQYEFRKMPEVMEEQVITY